MPVESDYTTEKTPHISIELQRFIFLLAEDVIRHSGSFERRKKRLRTRCEHEMLDYNSLEYNLNLFFELLEDYRKSSDPLLYRFLKLQAGYCFIDETDFLSLPVSPVKQHLEEHHYSESCNNLSSSSDMMGGIVGGHLLGLD
jgi:hypothetical protein